jgi:hypothetical protein
MDSQFILYLGQEATRMLILYFLWKKTRIMIIYFMRKEPQRRGIKVENKDIAYFERWKWRETKRILILQGGKQRE